MKRAFAALLLAFCVAAAARAGGKTLALSQLPVEAREVLERAGRGGPFRYDRDGVPFGNYERLLPPKARGYYREYTVRTPGVKHRGARRLVVGCERGSSRSAPRVEGGFEGFHDCSGAAAVYYTDDHYRSFRQVLP